MSWTSGNVAEAFPGVCTSLGFTFMHDPVELALRAAFFEIGVFPKSELRVPTRIEDQFWTVFDGRAAANIDQFRKLADVTPGTSATAVEEQLFGYVRPETVDNNSVRRYPAIFAKAPARLISLPKTHDSLFASLKQWRIERLVDVEVGDVELARSVLTEAAEQLQRVMKLHFLVAFVSSALAERVSDIAAKSGKPGVEAVLLSAVGSDDNEVAGDMWQLAHGQLSMGEFISRHGYHGPQEGQLDSTCWRENPSIVEQWLDEYRELPLDSPRSPVSRAQTQHAIREQAERELHSSLSIPNRAVAKRVVALCGRFLALRQQGKAGYLVTFDVARAAARKIGESLVAEGRLSQTSDIFHLTYDEVLDPELVPDLVTIGDRSSRHRERQSRHLPDAWTGVPIPIVARGTNISESATTGTHLVGVAGSGGVVEGRARVVTDPSDVDLDDGDILVCNATDPGWVGLFMVAGGVVTDLGGMLSHGAIVARELGVPCVCNTKSASTTIADGQMIRVDGTAGTVTILG
ncbi:phosphoenolpyruvate carboxykinase [Rhodococcus sp. SC4]|nr:phosphoenolpyruvate carboxykinase [Rhodococcus sp. SC4]